jgi:beta-mannosidase
MGLYYQKPNTFEDYVYASQVLQAEGLKTAIEAHRSAMPYCMGTLYWQFNDCWPVVSWSSADYYQNKKAAYYFVKKSFETNLLTFKKQKDSLQVYLVSDSLREMQVSYKLRVMDFSGKVFWETNQSLKVAPQKVTLLSQQAINTLVAMHPTGNLMAVATVYKADGSSTEQVYYFEAVKNLTLKKDTILMTQRVQNNVLEITLVTPSLKKNIQLTTAVAGEFSDNYFDLLPNQPKKIYFKLSNENDYNNMPLALSGTLKAINFQTKYLVNSILKK